MSYANPFISLEGSANFFNAVSCFVEKCANQSDLIGGKNTIGMRTGMRFFMACAGEFRFFGQQPVPMHDVWRMATNADAGCVGRDQRPAASCVTWGCDVVSATTKHVAMGKSVLVGRTIHHGFC